MEASILLDIAKIELDKENDEIAKSYLNRACSIYSSQLLYIKDLPITKSSIELDNLSAVYNNLGIIFYKRGDYSNAKEHFIKAHEFKNNSATVYNNLANVYAKVGDIERAESCYHQALIYKPELKAARENIKLLRKSEPVSWWDWWFHSDTMLRDEKVGIGRLTDKILRFGSLKKSIGVLLLVVLFSLLASVAVPVVPIMGGGYTEEKTTVENSTVINTTAANITFINTTFGNTTAGNATIGNTTIGNTTLANITKVSSTTIPSVSKSPINDYNKGVINLSSTVTTKTNQTKTVSPEIRLLFAALVIFLLLHPQIRGFSAGTIKIDLEPTAVSKGSKDQFTVMSL